MLTILYSFISFILTHIGNLKGIVFSSYLFFDEVVFPPLGEKNATNYLPSYYLTEF